MPIFQYQQKLSKRLLSWSILSMLASFPLLLDTHKPIRDTGSQFLGWGFIDAIIAIIGERSSRKKQAANVDPIKEARNLRRILWFNTALDVGYLAGGVHLLQRDNGKQRGHGFGIIIQGGFLFFFDIYHALKTP